MRVMTPSGEERSRQTGPYAGRRTLRVGLLLSAAVHAVLLAVVGFTFPRLDRTGRGWTFQEVDLPPRVEVPAPPEPVEKPPSPALARVEVEEPALVTGEPEPPASAAAVPEPPRVRAVPPSSHREAVPRDVPPLLETSDRFRRRLRRSYDRVLRRSGGVEAEGVVRIRFFVDPRGDVSRVRIASSSGHRSLDRLARKLVEKTEFRPALNRDRTVGVWVSQPICFVRAGGGKEEAIEAECRRGVALGGR